MPPWLSYRRLAVLAIAAWYIALVVISSGMGLMGNMFEGFFGTLGPPGTPAAGTPAAGTGQTGAVATPTVRR